MSDLNKFFIKFSEEAFEDLSQIQTYTKLTFGDAQKVIYENKLNKGLEKLSVMPTIGHKSIHLKSELFIYSIEKHLIIYNFSDKENIISIARILHHKTNLKDIL
jgi:toxin ParE1/3/4